MKVLHIILLRVYYILLYLILLHFSLLRYQWNGDIVKLCYGEIVLWQYGEMVKWWNSEMAKWWNGNIIIYINNVKVGLWYYIPLYLILLHLSLLHYFLDLLLIIYSKLFRINTVSFLFIIFVVSCSHFSIFFVVPGIFFSKLIFSWARLSNSTWGILEWYVSSLNGCVLEPDISLASYHIIGSKWPNIDNMRLFFFWANPFRSTSLGCSWQLLRDGRWLTSREVTWNTSPPLINSTFSNSYNKAYSEPW